MPLMGPLPSKWYSGYLATASPSRSLHYIYVESLQNPSKDPVLVWFNGGPGCSSMLGFIQEHGPYVIEDHANEIVANPYPWNQRANVLYLESPAGVGFSYALDEDDLQYTDHSQSIDTFAALRDFYRGFPELLTNDLYITGESYAGIYAPFLAYQIHSWNAEKTAASKFNPTRPTYPLKGFIIGNGCTDWEYDTYPHYAEAFYKYGRINQTTYDLFNAFNCQYWYRDLKTKENDARCKDLWAVIRDVPNKYNIYNLLWELPQQNVTTVSA